MDLIESVTPGFSIILDTALKGAILIAAAAAAAHLLRRRSAAGRHAVWTAAVLGHLALPALIVVAPEWRLPIMQTPAWMVPAERITPDASARGADDQMMTAQTAASPIQWEPAPADDAAPAATPPAGGAGGTVATASMTVLSYLALVWVIGAGFVLLRLVVGTWRVSRLAREGARVDDGEWLSLTQRIAARLGIARPLTLLRGDRLGIPVTWGVVYPAVLLPPESAEWPESRRRFVLVHEMAHVKRFDALTQLGSQIALAVFWFDPLVWYAVRRMTVERERACDDYVLRDGTVPSLYAGELLDMVRSLGTRRREQAAPAFAALAMARPAELEGRMLAILDPAVDRGPLHRRGTFITAALVALLALPLAAVQPFASPAPAAAPTTPAPLVTPKPPDAAMRSEEQPPATAFAAGPDSRGESGSGQGRTCDGSDVVLDGSLVLNSSHTGDDKVRNYRSIMAGRCFQLSLRGEIQFADDDRSIVRLGEGAHAFFRERLLDSDRSVEVRRGPGGQPLYTARFGGREVPFDGAMRGWLAAFLPEALREAAINVPARVARLRARGGTPAVLDEIARIRSSGAKRAHYRELIRTPSLTQREAGAVVGHASQQVSSSGDLRNILQSVPPRLRSGAELRSGLAEAIQEISSSGDKAAVLAMYGDTDDPAMLTLALTEARRVSSSGDKARLLARLAPRAVGHADAAVSDAFFDAAETIQSSGDLARTLSAAMNSGRSTEGVSLAIIRATERISSSGDKSRVLQDLARRRRVNTPKLREAYLAAARKVTSDGDYRRVMDAISRVEGSL